MWTLKCLLNRSDILSRIANGELVPLRTEPSTSSVQVYYGYQTESGPSLITKLHWHLNPDGSQKSPKDPKQIYVETHGIDYHPHKGGRWWNRLFREPETEIARWWQDLWMVPKDNKEVLKHFRLAYGAWRKFKCAWFGPIAAHRRRLWISAWRAVLALRTIRAAILS